MSKRMPEEEVRALREAVEGLDAFGKLRGKMCQTVAGLVAETIKTSETPTAYLSTFGDMLSRLRIVTFRMAKLWRHGHKTAFEEVVQALLYSDHRMPYEATAPCPKTPITLIMLDPARTMAVIKWAVMGNVRDIRKHFEGNPTELTTALFSQLSHVVPQVKEILSGGGMDYYSVFANALYRVLSPLFCKSLGVCKEKFGTSRMQALHLQISQYNPILDFTSVYPFYVFAGTQQEVLSEFSRAEQDLLASWQFNVPEDAVGADRKLHLVIGLHPQEEHPAWKMNYPDWCSISVNCGLGAIVLGQRGVTSFTAGEKDELVLVHAGWKNDPPALRFKINW